MRWMGWILFGLTLAGWLIAQSSHPAAPEPAADVAWRRTRDGWQQATWLLAKDSLPAGRPALHPAVVGALELLLALMVLIAFEPAVRSPDQERGSGDASPAFRR